MSKKLTYDFIKSVIGSEGYQLISTEYKSNKEKLLMICPNNHEWESNYNNFVSQGNRCLTCSGKEKHTYEYIKEQFAREGYQLISKEYVNNHQYLDVICPQGHNWKLKYSWWLDGNRCLKCSGKEKHTYEYVKQYIESENYKLLSNEYNGVFNKLKIQCDNGHIYESHFGNFKNCGNRCPTCYMEIEKFLSYDHVKEFIEDKGYKLLSNEYINSKEKIVMLCDKGHEFKMSYNSFQSGERCPRCYAMCTTSRMEKAVLGEVKKLYDGKIIENDRSQVINHKTGRYLELDIWLPEIKTAIEFNGNYWHGPEKNKYKDTVKQEQCKNKGIILVIITEDDWRKDKNMCVNKINDQLIRRKYEN